MNATDSPRPSGRRRFLLAGFVSLIAGLLGRCSAAAAAAKTSGEPVTTRMRQGEPPTQPLDTILLFERGDDNNGRAMTHEVLSLIHQEKGKHSLRLKPASFVLDVNSDEMPQRPAVSFFSAPGGLSLIFSV